MGFGTGSALAVGVCKRGCGVLYLAHIFETCIVVANSCMSTEPFFRGAIERVGPQH